MSNEIPSDDTTPKENASEVKPYEAHEVYSGGLTDGDLRRPMMLGDFLLQMGIVMRLPERKEDPISVSGDRFKVQWGRVSLVAAGMLSMAMLLMMQLPDKPDSRTVPDEILGTWVPLDPRYSGRTFVLAESTVTLTFGDTLARRYPIDRVDGIPSREGSQYVIHYVTDDGLVEFPLMYQGFRIELPHPAGVAWTRTRVRERVPGTAAVNAASR